METWRPAIGFEGFYEVSDYGNVRRFGKTQNLSKTINKDGYEAYVFSIKRVRRNVLGHRLVAMAFIGPVPSGLIVLHNDGIKTNNKVSNLRYGTNAENSQDMVNHNSQCKGEDSHLSKLTEQQVREIRSSKLSLRKLAKIYGVSRGNISMIKNHVTWTHVQ